MRRIASLLFASGAFVRAASTACQGPYKAQITSLGCYSDSSSSRTLNSAEAYDTSADNTAQDCADACGAAGFAYAGTEYGRQCFCGNEISFPGAKLDDSKCNVDCTGDSGMSCGGYNTINIYKIANPSKTPTIPGLPNCNAEPLCSNPICDTSLSVQARVDGLISKMTLTEKANNMQHNSPGVPRLGIPPYQWWNEALHGVASSPGVKFASKNGSDFSYATSFPLPILMGAAFDDDLINQVATTIGKEGRAFANHGKAGFDFWTPNINPFRDPRWGRGLETPGEDPFHLQSYVYNLVTGLQGGLNPAVKTVIATCKHYAVYDVEEKRESDDIDPSVQDLAEYYLPTFKTCARDANVGAVMCSYNAEYGIPSCANRYLLQNILREEWKWAAPHNWVVSDCAAIADVVKNHKYVDSNASAAAVSVNAGTDMACDTYYANLADAVAQNITTEATIDKSLSRLYASLIQVGYFNSPSHLASLGWEDVGTSQAQNLAYLAAAEGMTLLKNDGILPLAVKISNVAVIGPWSNATTQMQGNYQGTAPYLISPFTAFKSAWSNVVQSVGTGISSTSTSNLSAALEAAKNADYIIYCGGIDTSVEAEGKDRGSISWPGNQLDLISQLAALKKRLIVVQFGGGQVDDSSLLSDPGVNAIVWAGYPGQEGGNALKDVLTAEFPIAGRLPITQYPANYTTGLSKFDPGLRPDKSTGNPGRTSAWFPDPVLPMGYGDIPGRKLFHTVSINVKNTGKVGSDYVGLLFLSTKNAGPAPYPIRKLVSYDRVKGIKAGRTGNLSFKITLESLSRVDIDGQRYLFPGDYQLVLDVDASVKILFKLTGEKTLIESLPPLPNHDTVPISYLGCYTGQPENIMSGPSSDLGGSNSPQVCSDKCAKNQYSLSGTQGTKCYCGSILKGSATDESKCNTTCTGNLYEQCGGKGALTVFNATLPVHPEPPTWSG